MPDMEAELTAALDAYLANADYFETGSVSKAKAMITAYTRLVGIVPTLSSQGSRHVNDMRENLKIWAAAIRDAKEFVVANSGGDGSGVRHFDLSRSRD